MNSISQSGANRIPKSTIVWLAGCAGITVVLVTAMMGSLSYRFGSFAAARAYLRGEPFILLPETLKLGPGSRGETRDVSLKVVNLSGQPLQIIGVRSSCGCVVVRDDLPAEIPGHGSLRLDVRVHFVGHGSEFLQSVTVYSDLPGAGSPLALIRGQIRDSVVASE
jgi:hypothetical protein